MEVWELPEFYKLSALFVLYTYMSFLVSYIVPFIPWHTHTHTHTHTHNLLISSQPHDVTSQQHNRDSHVIISSTTYLYLHVKIFRHGLINSGVKDPEIHSRQHKRPQLQPTVSTYWKSREPWNRPKLLYDTFFDSLVYRLGSAILT
jgi:hypothetical protein